MCFCELNCIRQLGRTDYNSMAVVNWTGSRVMLSVSYESSAAAHLEVPSTVRDWALGCSALKKSDSSIPARPTTEKSCH